MVFLQIFIRIINLIRRIKNEINCNYIFKKEHFILKNKNNHTLKLIAGDDKFVVEEKKENSFSTTIVYVSLAIIALGAVYLIIKRKK